MNRALISIVLIATFSSSTWGEPMCQLELKIPETGLKGTYNITHQSQTIDVSGINDAWDICRYSLIEGNIWLRCQKDIHQAAVFLEVEKASKNFNNSEQPVMYLSNISSRIEFRVACR